MKYISTLLFALALCTASFGQRQPVQGPGTIFDGPLDDFNSNYSFNYPYVPTSGVVMRGVVGDPVTPYTAMFVPGPEFELNTTLYTMDLTPLAPVAVTRSFNSNFQPSASYGSTVVYTVTSTATLTLTGGQTYTVTLQQSANGSTGWVTMDTYTNSNTGTLTIGLALATTYTGHLAATIRPSYYVRLVTSGSTATYVSGFETILW